MKLDRRFLLMGILLLALAGIGLVLAVKRGKPRDLVYGGRQLSEWVRHWQDPMPFVSMSAMLYIPGSNSTALDSNAAPYLVWRLQRPEQPWEKWETRHWTNFPAWLQRHFSKPVPITTIWLNALTMLQHTGSGSPETIQAIVEFARLEGTNSGGYGRLRDAALITIEKIGVNSHEAEHGVIELISDQTNVYEIDLGFSVLRAICTNDPSVVPELLPLLRPGRSDRLMRDVIGELRWHGTNSLLAEETLMHLAESETNLEMAQSAADALEEIGVQNQLELSEWVKCLNSTTNRMLLNCAIENVGSYTNQADVVVPALVEGIRKGPPDYYFPTPFKLLARLAKENTTALQALIKVADDNIAARHSDAAREAMNQLGPLAADHPAALAALNRWADVRNNGEAPFRWDIMWILVHVEDGHGIGLRSLAAMALDENASLSARLQACEVMDSVHEHKSPVIENGPTEVVLQSIRDRANQELKFVADREAANQK